MDEPSGLLLFDLALASSLVVVSAALASSHSSQALVVVNVASRSGGIGGGGILSHKSDMSLSDIRRFVVTSRSMYLIHRCCYSVFYNNNNYYAVTMMDRRRHTHRLRFANETHDCKRSRPLRRPSIIRKHLSTNTTTHGLTLLLSPRVERGIIITSTITLYYLK